MKMKKFFLILILFILPFASCKKETVNHSSAAQIYIPNSLTPYSFGQNAYWRPIGTGIASIYFDIRNDDGIILFKSYNLNT